uniref:Calcineurin-like phosphoesterase domain-containing protein n=1 Tax=Moniliophthora roreri TaxID=221103 RepID=A0A0W0EXW3_MONRR
MATYSAFFYGTLMHPKVLRRVIGVEGKHLQIAPAVLLDYTRHKVKRYVQFAEYPGIIPYPTAREKLLKQDINQDDRCVRGSLVVGLTERDILFLDVFEGSEYQRQKVKAYPLEPLEDMEKYSTKGDGSLVPVHPPPIPEHLPLAVDAETYLYVAPDDLEAELWSFAEFVSQNAYKWYSPDSRAREDIVEVDKLRQELIALQEGFPDFSKYVELETLSEEQFPIEDEQRRVILVGDVHGMDTRLQALLRRLSYDPSTDVLVNVGDIIAKGSHAGSMAVLDFMASNNITAVRGNHDQKVIEWRVWLNWVHSISGGTRWLGSLREKWIAAQKEGEDDVDEWVAKEMKKDRTNKKWWKRIPHGWKLFSDHYEIAAAMTDAQFQYLVSRPLRLHVPSAHTFIVHAGLLASDPERDPWDKRQPLATVPKIPRQPSSRNPILRRLQELAILSKVPQNLDPWVTLNMRSVTKQHKVIRKKGGTPWAKLYNEDMSLCTGFDNELHADGKSRKVELPCRPATVIYGHAAARGLDVKRWTIGLDTGCVYKRRLTALVLGGKYASTYTDTNTYYISEDGLEEDGQEDEVFDIDGKRVRSIVRFGEHGKGKLYSVSCS